MTGRAPSSPPVIAAPSLPFACLLHMRIALRRLLQLLLREDDDPATAAFGVQAELIPSVALESEPGDVIVFTGSVYHGSFGSKAGRLQITAQFIANPTTDRQIQRLKELHDRFDWLLHPPRSYINSDRPRIQRMVSRLVELGFTPSDV